MSPQTPSKTPCPICGGPVSAPGPQGRLSPAGTPPRCAGCGGLERHRAYHRVLAAIAPLFAGESVLQFSDDPSAPRAAFERFEVSVFGGPNSLDLAAIARPDGAYGLVIANHVLEHVEDDNAALAELDRITAPGGAVFLSVPDLLRVVRTREYGRARADKYGHWRLYGPDIVERWRRAAPHWGGVGVVAADPVTGAPDRATVLSRSRPRLRALSERLAAAGLAPFDAFG